MGISPHLYKDALPDGKRLILEAKAYLKARTLDGLQIPVRTISGAQELSAKCSMAVGELEVLDGGLLKESSQHKEYQSVIAELRTCIEELNKLQREESRGPDRGNRCD